MQIGISSEEMKEFDSRRVGEGKKPYVEASGAEATASISAAVGKTDGGDVRRAQDIHGKCHKRSTCVEEERRGCYSLSVIFYFIIFIYLCVSYSK